MTSVRLMSTVPEVFESIFTQYWAKEKRSHQPHPAMLPTIASRPTNEWTALTDLSHEIHRLNILLSWSCRVLVDVQRMQHLPSTIQSVPSLYCRIGATPRAHI